MNSRESNVKRCEADWNKAKSALRRANVELEQGKKKALAEYEIEYSKLQHEVTVAEQDLIEATAELEVAKEELAKGFEE